VTEDRRIGVGYGAQDPLGLGFALQPETAMDAGDDESKRPRTSSG
jgi:hypothetical protein